jgi:hypothetical protein
MFIHKLSIKLEAGNSNRGKINQYNDKYVSSNAKTKEEELFGHNPSRNHGKKGGQNIIIMIMIYLSLNKYYYKKIKILQNIINFTD